jgi:carboxyl-terminal processing protease
MTDKILEVLVPAGRIEIYAKYRNGNLEPYWSPPENVIPKVFSGKIVVLINENSASASELVAISLKEQLEAKIIGRKSFGKGTIQTVFPLPDGSALRLTTGHYLSPVSGEDIDGKGVIPDIEITDNPDTPQDEVIIKAIEILKN